MDNQIQIFRKDRKTQQPSKNLQNLKNIQIEDIQVTPQRSHAGLVRQVGQTDSSNININVQVQNFVEEDHGRVQRAQRRQAQQVHRRQNIDYQSRMSRKRNAIIRVIVGISISIGALVAILCIFVKRQESQEIVLKTNNIVVRNFQEGRVYHSLYAVNNEYDDYTIRVNYEMTIAVISTSSNLTEFAATLQKKSQEKIQSNGNYSIILFNQNNPYLDILLNGGNSTNQSSLQSQFSGPLDKQNSLNNQSLSTSFNGENSTLEFEPIIPIFRFSLRVDGKIVQYVFPKNLEKQTVGLLRGVVKLFSPLIDKDIYIQKKTTSKTKVTSGGVTTVYQGENQFSRLGNTSNNTSNTSNETTPNSVYEQINGYDYESSDDGTTLSNSGQVSSVDETHNTEQNNTQTNQFDQNGELLKGTQTSTTQFKTVQQQPDPNSSVLNINLTYSSRQTALMTVILNFNADKENIKVFQGFIIYYEERNQTIETDPTGLVKYVLGFEEVEQQQQPIRLLLQADGSLTLLRFKKDIRIVSTNVLGCEIAAFGYTLLRFSLYQDKKDKLKKIPKFNAQVGTIVKLGAKKFVVPLMTYEKQLPPLSLKFTLNQIQTVVDLLSGDFIARVVQIWDLIASGDFKKDLLPNILKILTLTLDVTGAITNTENQIAPISVITQIGQITLQIKNAIETQGLSLLNPQNAFIGSLSQDLLDFVGVSYSQALNIFQLTKNTFQALKNEGDNFLTEFLSNFINSDIKSVETMIRNLIPPEVYSQYEAQMKKAKDIYDFIKLVQKNGTEYLKYISQTFISQKLDFIKFAKGLGDLYFANQTIKTNQIFNIIQNRLSNVQTQVNFFKQLVSNFNISSMNDRVIDLLRSIYVGQFNSNLYFDNWNWRLSKLKNIAQQVSDNADQCCIEFLPGLWCIHNNTKYNDQKDQYSKFLEQSYNLQSKIETTLPPIIQFSNKYIKILNQNSAINDKFQDIKFQYQILNVTDTNFDHIINQLQVTLQRAQPILNYLNGCEVGNKNDLVNYVNQLNNFLSSVNSVKGQFQRVKQSAQNVIISYSPNVYNNIAQNFVIVEAVDELLERYKKSQTLTKSFISDLRRIVTQYNPQQFAKSNELINKVVALYGKVQDGLGVLCENFEEEKLAITQIRKQYQDKYNLINSLSNSFLSGQLTQIKQFLSSAKRLMFSKYLEIPFCEHKQKFTKQISTLTQDINNMTVIYQLYKTITDIIHNNQQNLQKITQKINILQKTFYKLFTPEGFRQFIGNTQNLTELVKELVYNVSIDFSNLKQQSKSIYVFQMAPLENLTKSLDVFVNSPFILSISKMFINIQDFVNKSLNVVDKLSFDVIAVIVISKDVVEYFQQTVNTFKNGIPKISTEFRDLCQSFLNLQVTTGQQYINRINNNFMNLLSTVNDTLFPRIKQKFNQIINRYQSYRFTIRSLQLIKNKCFEQLSNFAQIVQSTKQKVFGRMKQITDKIKELISKLEIGNLNQIYQLAIYIKNQFSEFMKYFTTDVLKKIIDYKDQILRDLRNLSRFGDFFNNLKSQIESKYEKTVSDIKSKIQETKKYFQQNQSSRRLLSNDQNSVGSTLDFSNKFKNSSAFAKMQLTGQKLVNNFAQIWNSLQEKEQKIKQFVQSISNQSLQLIRDLGDAKQKIQNVTKTAEQRFKNISNEFQSVVRKLTNIKSLIFTTLNEQLGDTIMKSMRKIITDMDNIIYIDLMAIKLIADTTLGNRAPLVGQAIQLVVNLYNRLVPIRDNLVNKIQTGLKKIDQFLASEVVTKMQKLKNGVLYIKAVVQNAQDPKNIVVFRKQLYAFQAPILKFKQPIITAIGVFMIYLDIDYRIDINAYIVLREFRSIDCKVVFQASLLLDLRFCYGIPFVLQFGLFVKGSIIRAQVTPMLQFNNIIPIQLIKTITDIPQISQQNIVTIDFVVDLAIYAVQLQVGFYIGHIWIEIIWVQVKICFFKCFRIRIPVGFRIFTKRHDYGWKINGIVLLKKRILTLPLFKFQY